MKRRNFIASLAALAAARKLPSLPAPTEQRTLAPVPWKTNVTMSKEALDTTLSRAYRKMQGSLIEGMRIQSDEWNF
jgi:hypothetical protein